MAGNKKWRRKIATLNPSMDTTSVTRPREAVTESIEQASPMDNSRTVSEQLIEVSDLENVVQGHAEEGWSPMADLPTVVVVNPRTAEPCPIQPAVVFPLCVGKTSDFKNPNTLPLRLQRLRARGVVDTPEKLFGTDEESVPSYPIVGLHDRPCVPLESIVEPSEVIKIEEEMPDGTVSCSVEETPGIQENDRTWRDRVLESTQWLMNMKVPVRVPSATTSGKRCIIIAPSCSGKSFFTKRCIHVQDADLNLEIGKIYSDAKKEFGRGWFTRVEQYAIVDGRVRDVLPRLQWHVACALPYCYINELSHLPNVQIVIVHINPDLFKERVAARGRNHLQENISSLPPDVILVSDFSEIPLCLLDNEFSYSKARPAWPSSVYSPGLKFHEADVVARDPRDNPDLPQWVDADGKAFPLNLDQIKRFGFHRVSLHSGNKLIQVKIWPPVVEFRDDGRSEVMVKLRRNLLPCQCTISYWYVVGCVRYKRKWWSVGKRRVISLEILGALVCDRVLSADTDMVCWNRFSGICRDGLTHINIDRMDRLFDTCVEDSKLVARIIIAKKRLELAQACSMLPSVCFTLDNMSRL
jgi:hypothetical protein